MSNEGKVYVNQPIKITRIVGQDITAALAKKIKYKDPDGVTGEWDADVADIPTGTIYKNVPKDTIDKPEDWWFWGWIKFASGDEIPGEAKATYFYNEGE